MESTADRPVDFYRSERSLCNRCARRGYHILQVTLLFLFDPRKQGNLCLFGIPVIY